MSRCLDTSHLLCIIEGSIPEARYAGLIILLASLSLEIALTRAIRGALSKMTREMPGTFLDTLNEEFEFLAFEDIFSLLQALLIACELLNDVIGYPLALSGTLPQHVL